MTNSNETILDLVDVSFKYKDKIILYDINLRLKFNQLVTIVGPNGGGKSTLAKIIISALKPDTGQIIMKPNLKLGYVPQKIFFDSMLPMTVKNFLKLKDLYKINISRILQLIDINHLMNSQISQLSGGELQKILLVSCLLNDPNIIIFDEPIQGLDFNAQIEFYKLIQKIMDISNVSIIMISHDLHMVMKTTDYVICLNKHICCEGAPENINKNPVFHSIFGDNTLNNFAFYNHHHNHNH